MPSPRYPEQRRRGKTLSERPAEGSWRSEAAGPSASTLCLLAAPRAQPAPLSRQALLSDRQTPRLGAQGRVQGEASRAWAQRGDSAPTLRANGLSPPKGTCPPSARPPRPPPAPQEVPQRRMPVRTCAQHRPCLPTESRLLAGESVRGNYRSSGPPSEKMWGHTLGTDV